MEIDHRGLQGTVTQVLLDQAQVHAGLEQVRRVTVPERVDRNPLAEAELLAPRASSRRERWNAPSALWPRWLHRGRAPWLEKSRPGCDAWPNIDAASARCGAGSGT